MQNAFFINLARRTDRLKEIENEFLIKDMVVERFPAIEHTHGSIGCTMSHIAVLKLAQERDYESVMIFEDDFEFLISKKEWQTLLTQLPANYDVVMLAYNLRQSIPFDDTFDKVINAQTTSGYIVHRRFYNQLIARLEEGLQKLLKEPNQVDLYINDQYWKALQPLSNWYAFKVRIGRQRASYSDLLQTFVNYGV